MTEMPLYHHLFYKSEPSIPHFMHVYLGNTHKTTYENRRRKKMGENLKEMNFDVGSDFGSKTISPILTQVSGIDDFPKKLDFHVHELEEELRKIDAFKRELPNCMHLLKHAIERLKEEREREMEEFVVLKNESDGERRAKVSNDLTEKRSWMSSVQLWSTPLHYQHPFPTTNQHSLFPLNSGYEEGGGNGTSVSVTRFQGCNFKNRVGAFLPFKKEGTALIDGLSLSIPDAEVESSVNADRGVCRVKPQQPQPQEQQRKQRRCWSPELHKRFVDALHHLGGPQSATPKQIRELMKVDGLTNDEVKSHLQKYRIHIKKLPTSSTGPSNYSSLGRDQQEDMSKTMAAHSGSPQGPLHRGMPATGGDSMEEEEDEKSESYGWKGPIQKPSFE